MFGLIPLLFGAIAFGTGSTLFASQQSAPPNNRSALQNIPVAGTIPGGGRFAGRLDIVSFVNENGVLMANGLLDGTLYDATGGTVGEVANEFVTLPASLTTGSANAPNLPPQECPILHLELGPLDLNLLGLVVHLDRVVLDITAQGGPGNLLGNLLCAIAHLLDGVPPTPLDQIIALLNRVIDLLGG